MSASMYRRTVWSIVRRAWGAPPSRARGMASHGWSARLLAAGLVLFCGSIYALTFGAPRWFGMVAPLGGASFMLAWLLFAVSMLRDRRSPDAA